MTIALLPRTRTGSTPVRLLLVAVAVGLAVGALTSPAQTLLGGTALAGLANAVGPWLLAPFVLGARARSPRVAVLAGVLACTAQVPGYYLVAAARGFAASTPWVLVWTAGGLVGGAVLGLAGWAWWTRTDRWRGAGAGLLVAVWLTEALVVFGAVLRYTDSAVVSGVVGLGLLVGLGRHGRQWGAVLRWLAPALALGTAGFLALHAVL
ncbi:DUF6518 family protein [Klenkia sp. PcliD-1-E]|uniref:DUF6518 family protein n=1 Tax=Klenkia sp. PcliD-1-E TaxID=2954492 RepID=UPI002097C9A8|nr:DUF6518 family protein [Klenkia sp. PcliD-1-E]MCO7219737.1 DUF6518 family protein [Klenkia sp. PcliD-1-E]